MIKLSEHRTGLVNLPGTILALEQIDDLIKHYSEDKPGPAYVEFKHVLNARENPVQINRSIMVETLYQQRQHLIAYLATLGIDATA